MANNDSKDRKGIALASLKAEKAGFVLRETSHSDFGIDAFLEMRVGDRVSGRILGAQVKAGASYLTEQTNSAYIFRDTLDHVELWQKHTAPVIVLLCDLEKEIVYWESISKGEIGPKGGWRLEVPKTQALNEGAEKLRAHCHPVSDFSVVRILEEQDISTGVTRRVEIKAEILPGTKALSKAMFEEASGVVRTAGEISTYYRNKITEEMFKGQTSDIIFGFLYSSASYLEFGIDWVCKFTWCRPGLSPDYYPIGYKAPSNPYELEIEWNETPKFSDAVESLRSSKSEYLAYADAIIYLLKQVDLATSASTVTEDTLNFISKIKEKSEKPIFYPYECSRLGESLAGAMAAAETIKLLSEDQNMPQLRKSYLVGQQFELLRRDLARTSVHRDEIG